jgi:WD40 repeat protein
VGIPFAAAFSPDGRWLATGGTAGDASQRPDETVRLWDLSSPDTGIGCVVLRGYASRCAALAFTADSHHLVTQCGDGEIRVWDLRLDQLIQRARRAAGRELTPEEREKYVLPSILAGK